MVFTDFQKLNCVARLSLLISTHNIAIARWLLLFLFSKTLETIPTSQAMEMKAQGTHAYILNLRPCNFSIRKSLHFNKLDPLLSVASPTPALH